MRIKLVSKSKDGSRGEVIVTRPGKAPKTIHVAITHTGNGKDIYSPVGLREGRGAMFESPAALQRSKEDYKDVVKFLTDKEPEVPSAE
jgi:hypothetical protein